MEALTCTAPTISSRSTSPAARSSAARPSRRPSTRSASRRPAVRVVAGDHACSPPGRICTGADQRLDQLDRRGVEVCAWLVEQQQLGVVQRRPGHGGTLHHPAREVFSGSSARSAQRHGVEQLLDALCADAVQARVKAQVLARGQLAVQQRLVPEQPDAPAHGPRLLGEARAEHAHLAVVWPQQRREHPQQRRLARPVRPEHDQRLACRERQRDIAERLAFAVAAHEPFQPEHRSSTTSLAPAGVATARVGVMPRSAICRRCRSDAGRGGRVRALRRRDQLAHRVLAATSAAAQHLDRVGVAVDDPLEELLAVLVGRRASPSPSRGPRSGAPPGARRARRTPLRSGA